MLIKIISSLFILTSQFVLAQEANTDKIEPYWEYGLGFGYIHYEHYPATNQFSNLLIPFPTFQYRGKILRANDREGARAYLLKGSNWDFEISGTFYPALDSTKNEARQGMENLPWLIALGPQLVYKPLEGFIISFGIFQALSTDLQMTRASGEIFEGVLSYHWFADSFFGKLSYKLKGGTKEFLSTYYEVPPSFATSTRPAYNSKDGFLNHELAYYQAFKTGRATIYLGCSLENYTQSANRESPLHKADVNLTYFAGVTYVLGESSKRGIPEDGTSGLINRKK